MYTVEVYNKVTEKTDYIVVDDLEEIDTSIYIIVEFWSK